uniref:C3H1-type domain-containing protein n=1 Tax=Mycena chlorophos TaxID=658473 RepID=A0ABQ0MBM3_MYCCL|nr:predicted protein [Mycena chlorophos]
MLTASSPVMRGAAIAKAKHSCRATHPSYTISANPDCSSARSPSPWNPILHCGGLHVKGGFLFKHNCSIRIWRHLASKLPQQRPCQPGRDLRRVGACGTVDVDGQRSRSRMQSVRRGFWTSGSRKKKRIKPTVYKRPVFFTSSGFSWMASSSSSSRASRSRSRLLTAGPRSTIGPYSSVEMYWCRPSRAGAFLCSGKECHHHHPAGPRRCIDVLLRRAKTRRGRQRWRRRTRRLPSVEPDWPQDAVASVRKDRVSSDKASDGASAKKLAIRAAFNGTPTARFGDGDARRSGQQTSLRQIEEADIEEESGTFSAVTDFMRPIPPKRRPGRRNFTAFESLFHEYCPRALMARVTFVPKDGVFAVLKIDPVASLAFLNDPAAIRAAEMVAFHEYVVFVPGTGQFRHQSISYREEIVEFLMYGPAPDTPELGINSAMSIPISPTTDSDRPHVSREPLQPSCGGLPWSNCYLTAFLRETVRCATVIRDDPVLCRIGRSEIRRHDEMIISDQLRQTSAYAALLEAEHVDEEEELADEAASVVSGSSEPSEDGASIPDGIHVYFDPRGADADGLTAEEKEDAAELQFLDALLAHRRPQEAPDDMLTVTFTHDLSRVSELRSPRLFYEEQEEIERIIAESMERKRRAADEEDERLYAEKTVLLLAARDQAPAVGSPLVNKDATLAPPPLGPSTGVFASVLQFGKRCVSLMWH